LVPDPVTGVYSYGARSGLITGIAADADLLNIHNGENNFELAIRRLSVGFVTTTAFAAAQLVDFYAIIARTWSTYGGGGTAISTAGSYNQRNVLMPPTVNISLNIATTGALTAGTKTLDGTAVGYIGGWSAAAGTTIPLTELLNIGTGEQPIVLRTDEGITVRSGTAFGGSGVGRLYVGFELMYCPAGTF
jgi:hypothetical protein